MLFLSCAARFLRASDACGRRLTQSVNAVVCSLANRTGLPRASNSGASGGPGASAASSGTAEVASPGGKEPRPVTYVSAGTSFRIDASYTGAGTFHLGIIVPVRCFARYDMSACLPIR